jgi:putative ABC transport system permease protein
MENKLGELARRLFMLLRRGQFDADLDEEMRLHRELREQEQIERGLSPKEAHYGAQRRFGNDLVLREESRDMWGWNWLENLLQDVRYGLRQLRRNPGFTAVAVLTLALGIGANTVMFSVVNSVLLRPLPYENPEELMRLDEKNLPRLPHFSVAPANFLSWQQQGTSFEEMAAFTGWDVALTGVGVPEQVVGARVSANLFATLGIIPAEGRSFRQDEDRPGRDQVVLVGYNLWRRRFGADPALLGRPMTLDGQTYTVVGIMPRGFQFPSDVEIWKPLALTPADRANRGGHFLEVIGRLKPSVTRSQAQAEMETIAGRLELQYPEDKEWRVNVTPLLEAAVGNVRPALLVLLGAVAFVLIITCANVANLLLVRAGLRQREVSIRLALGARRLRIVRQLLTESLVLALLGGVLGCLLTFWGIRLVGHVAQASIPRMEQVAMDPLVFGFTAAVSLLTGVLFGLAPSLQASRPDLNASLKEGGRSAGRQIPIRLRNGLVISELALALTLSVGAGLLTKSFVRLLHVPLGFNPENVLTMLVSLPPGKYAEAHQVSSFVQKMVSQTQTLPGVQSAAAVYPLPLSGGPAIWGFVIEGRPIIPGQEPSASARTATPHYFLTMQISLLKGRDFSERDGANAPGVVIINDVFARRYFPDQDPIGKRIKFDPKAANAITIVGVVSDVRYSALDVEPGPEMYFPHEQTPSPQMVLVIRTTIDPMSLVNAVRNKVLLVDKDQPVSHIQTMPEIASRVVAEQRLTMLLFAAFAGFALVLAAVGIYGVLAYLVTQRRHEIGIRIALGAQRGDILRLIVRQGMALAVLGLGIGVAASYVLTRLMVSLLYQVYPTDPPTFAAVSLLLVAVALLASYIPARRATKVDPMVALRCE